MLDRIFDTDNVVFRFFNTVGYIWWLHILWLVCSIPIVTIGASTTALLFSCMKLRNRDGYVTRNFFHSFKDNFRQSTILFLVLIITGCILLFDLLLCSSTDSFVENFVKYGAMALMIPYSMTLLYVFAIQAKFVNPVAKTLRYAFLAALKYFGYTIQMIFIVAVFLILNTTIVLANFITLSIGIGVMAYILSIYYNKIFAKMILSIEGD